MAVIDQGIYSGGSFVVNVLLARWMSPAEYGAYAVAFTVFLFLSGFHSAFILEPMSVIGPARYAGQLGDYLTSQVRLHWAMTLPLGLLLLGAGGIWHLAGGDPMLAQALAGAGLSLPLMLLIWLTRRLSYIIRRPDLAMAGSLVFALLSIGGIVILHTQDWISLLWVFLISGLASLVGAAFTLRIARTYLTKSEGVLPLKVLVVEQWKYGKFPAGASLLALGAGQIQTFLAAGMISLEAAGALKALQNFMLPMAQTVTAIASLGLPALAFEYGRGDLRALRNKGMFITITLTGLAAFYELGLMVFAKPLESLLYAGMYARYIPLIPLIGLIPLLTAIGAGFGIILRSINRPESHLVVNAILAPAGVISAVILTALAGVQGNILSLVLVFFLGLVCSLVLYQLWFIPVYNARIEA